MSTAVVRQYILYYPGGDTRTITVPAKSRVTFEYKPRAGAWNALRVYEGPTQSSLVAVFTGITEFRLSTIRVEGSLRAFGGRAIEDEEAPRRSVTTAGQIDAARAAVLDRAITQKLLLDRAMDPEDREREMERSDAKLG